MTATVAAEVFEVGSVAVDRRIAKLFVGLPSDATVKLTMVSGVMVLQSGRSRYRVDSLTVEGFPPTLALGEAAEFTLSDETGAGCSKRRASTSSLTPRAAGNSTN